MKILVAEDDHVSRRMLRATLEKWGYEVCAACDGEEAMKILQRPDSPKFAILDWSMPKMDGLEVVRKVRKRSADNYVYTMLLTAKSQKEDMLEGMTAGADDYLTKPLAASELKVRLHAAERIIALQNDLISARESWRKQATRDTMTELWNRSAILDILNREIERVKREDISVSVIMADLDHFKQVNDTYGHRAGDIVLCEAAKRLKGAVRPYDMIGRYGGEEFIIVVPRCDSTFAAYVAERFCGSIGDKPFILDNGEINVTMSVGVVSMRGCENPDSDMLIQAADLALYRAKENGRNRVEVAQRQ